jgi:hypothetical protein
MRKITFILAAILALSFLVSCKEGVKNEEGTKTAETKAALKDAKDVSLKDLAAAITDSKLLGENTTLLTEDDEYGADVLEFTYGYEKFDVRGVESFIVSENESNEAYTCVVAVFGDTYSDSDFSEFDKLCRDYFNSLQSSLAPYAPEAANKCNDYVVLRFSLEGKDEKTANALYCILSDDDAELSKIIRDGLTEAFKAD